MAALTFFMVNTTSGGWQLMDETSPGADAQASPATGWIVSTGSTNRSEFQASTERAATTFDATTYPDGSLNTTIFDALRSDVTLNGDFASANWTINGVVRAANNGGSQDGRLYYRLFKADADGSNATEITSSAQQGALLTNVSTSADFNSSVTFNPGAFSITNQYLFVQIAWERTGAGAMTTSDINFRIGDTGTRVVTSDFTAGVTTSSGTSAGSATASATGASTAESSGTISGSATASAVGESVLEASGTSAASATASAVGESTAASSGTAAGTASASATGESTATSSGTAAGTATATGVGASTAESSGTSGGTSTASAVGESVIEGSGTAAGVGAASATGESTAATSGTVAGVATASAVGESAATSSGTSAGVASVAATGASTATASGESAGSATATGTGASTADASGSAAGTSTATGEGTTVGGDAATGSATGSSSTAATGSSVAASSGTVAGSASVAGFSGSAVYLATLSQPGNLIGEYLTVDDIYQGLVWTRRIQVTDDATPPGAVPLAGKVITCTITRARFPASSVQAGVALVGDGSTGEADISLTAPTTTNLPRGLHVLTVQIDGQIVIDPEHIPVRSVN